MLNIQFENRPQIEDLLDISGALGQEDIKSVDPLLGAAEDERDKICGDLYGMLPLVVNLPVLLLDHLDKHPDKRLIERKSVPGAFMDSTRGRGFHTGRRT